MTVDNALSRSAEFNRDYLFYKAALATTQADNDAFNAAFDLPLQDLAYEKSMEREISRRATKYSWESQKRQFKESVQLAKFSKAIGLG